MGGEVTMRAKVAVLRTRPETVLADYERLLDLAAQAAQKSGRDCPGVVGRRG